MKHKLENFKTKFFSVLVAGTMNVQITPIKNQRQSQFLMFSFAKPSVNFLK